MNQRMNGLYQKLDAIEITCCRLLCLKLEGLSRKTVKLNNCNSSWRVITAGSEHLETGIFSLAFYTENQA